MQYLNNSQDVIWNSLVCSGAYPGFQHRPSRTEMPLRSPVEPQELQRCSSSSLAAVAAALALAVTAWENIRHVVGEDCCVTRVRVSLASVLFGYHTLHFSAGCMAVPFLQWNTSENASKFCKDPITLNKEKELIYMDTVHGDWCSGKQSRVHKVRVRIQDTLCKKNTGDGTSEGLEQTEHAVGGFCPSSRLVDLPGLVKEWAPAVSYKLREKFRVTLHFPCLLEFGCQPWAALSFCSVLVQRVQPS